MNDPWEALCWVGVLCIVAFCGIVKEYRTKRRTLKVNR